MKEAFLIGLLLTGQAIPKSTNQSYLIQSTNQEISKDFVNKTGKIKVYEPSEKELTEILQNNIKERIIQGTVFYFQQHTTAKLTKDEQYKLKKDIEIFLKQYPDIITISGNKILLNLNENIFGKLFKILLPYFSKGDALKDYPKIIKNNDSLILNHIKKSKGDKAEHYFYRFFGFFIMDIVNEINKVQNCDMTIGEYKNSMLKGLYIPSIDNQKLSKNISDDSIKNLSNYFK